MMAQTGLLPAITLAELLPGTWLPSAVGAVVVSGLCLDHRKLVEGDLFIAMPGTKHDGRRYINDAIKLGAIAILKAPDSDADTISWQGEVPIIPFPLLEEKVSEIAGNFFSDPSTLMNVVGVTGTNGKSTVTHLLAQLHQLTDSNAGVVGTLGFGMMNQLGNDVDDLVETGLTTADPIATQQILAELKDKGAVVVAMEVSSHSLQQHRVDAVDFEAAIFTNLTRDHLDYHGDMESYGRAKQRLLVRSELSHCVVNFDDEYGRRFATKISPEKSKPNTKLWTYSIRDSKAAVYAKEIHLDANGISAYVVTPWGEGQLRSSLLGEFNLSNLLAVLTTFCAQGGKFKSALEQMEKLKPVAGRMEIIRGSVDFSIVVDYAHTSDSLIHVLKALRAHTEGRLWCLFGCGGDRDRGKRPLMAKAAEEFADVVIVTSDNPRSESLITINEDIRAGFKEPENVTFFDDRAMAIKYCLENAAKGDCVLIAGKGHENYQLIGDNRLPFSDAKQARLALRELGV